MKRSLLMSVVLLGFMGLPVMAQEHPPQQRKAPPPQCLALEKLKSSFDATTKVTVLTPGQFHFVQGMYVGAPFTTPGLPPGDGALMVDAGGHAGIVWTRGKQGCITFLTFDEHHAGYTPMPVDAKVVAGIKTGKDETAPVEDTSKDLSL